MTYKCSAASANSKVDARNLLLTSKDDVHCVVCCVFGHGSGNGQHWHVLMAVGVMPPYARYDHDQSSLQFDWRWAVGATPFGPYSNYSGVSESMHNAARRNLLLAHVSAALKHLQHELDRIDGFVAGHFAGPWEAAGMMDSNRHWLDTVAR